MIQRLFLLALLTSLTFTGADPVTGPAGVYTVTTTGPTRVTSGEGWVKIEWDVEPTIPAKPEPPPVVTPPPPPPAPSVSIGPLAAPIWIAAIYDKTTASNLPKAQQDLLLSKTISSELKPLGATWSSWEKGDPGLKDWGPDAGSTFPVVLVIWDHGAKSKTFPLASDEAAQLAFVKQLRGQ